MSKLPAIKGRDLVKLLKNMKFDVARTKGSHLRLSQKMAE